LIDGPPAAESAAAAVSGAVATVVLGSSSESIHPAPMAIQPSRPTTSPPNSADAKGVLARAAILVRALPIADRIGAIA
jgi:hypothetical protein